MLKEQLSIRLATIESFNPGKALISTDTKEVGGSISTKSLFEIESRKTEMFMVLWLTHAGEMNIAKGEGSSSHIHPFPHCKLSNILV
jgi:hypothetical protein